MALHTRRIFYALLGVTALCLPSAGMAQDPGSKATPATPAIPATPLIRPGQAAAQEAAQGPFDALKKEYEDAYAKWVEQIYAQEDVEPEKRVYSKSPASEFFARFHKLAQTKDLQATAWVLSNSGDSPLPAEETKKIKMQCLQELARHPQDSDCIRSLSQALMYDWNPKTAIKWQVADELVATILPKVKNREDQARLIYARSSVHQRRGEDGSKVRFAALKTLQKDYADTPIGKRAAGIIFDMNNLQIGMTPPGFTGADVDDNMIQLADYRGKVTFLVFWGFW
jgi:hypothetical protein